MLLVSWVLDVSDYGSKSAAKLLKNQLYLLLNKAWNSNNNLFLIQIQ